METFFVNPNRMAIYTGHKEFDSQARFITYGNQIGNVVLSTYVRGELDEGEGLGDYPTNKRAPGYLRNFDLDCFTNVPRAVRSEVERHTNGTKQSVILYNFFHYARSGAAVSHGWVITTGDRQHLATIRTGVAAASGRILDVVKQYIIDGHQAARQLPEDWHETAMTRDIVLSDGRSIHEVPWRVAARRRYGRTTYTWVEAEVEAGLWVSVGDPWPTINPARAAVVDAVANLLCRTGVLMTDSVAAAGPFIDGRGTGARAA